MSKFSKGAVMLTGKVVIVTGGAGRIGSEFVKTILKNNGIVVVADIDEQAANKVINQVKSEISAESENIAFINLDISSARSVQSLISTLHTRFGRIDALVNNAYPKSKSYGKKLFEIDHFDFSEFLTLHLGGYFNISQQLIKYFLEQDCGNIINISSIQGVSAPAFETYEGTDMHSPIEYTVAKHGLLGMTKYLAKMFKKNNIRVNAISPGGILSGQSEIFLEQYKKRCGTKGMLAAEDLNGALLFLLSDASKYVTGQNLIVDDGFGL